MEEEQILFVFEGLFYIHYTNYDNRKAFYNRNKYFIRSELLKKINLNCEKLYFAEIDLYDFENNIKKVLTNYIVIKKNLKIFKEFCYKVDNFFNNFVNYPNNFMIKCFHKYKRSAKNRIKHIVFFQKNRIGFLENDVLASLNYSKTESKQITFQFKYYLDIKNIKLYDLDEYALKEIVGKAYISTFNKKTIEPDIFFTFIKNELTTKKMWEIINKNKTIN